MTYNCIKCGVELTKRNTSLSAFKSYKSGGMRKECRLCRKTGQHPHRKAAPSLFIWHRAKRNAKLRGIVFSLNLKDIPDIPKHCTVFPWIELKYEVGAGRKDSSPSLDRIDSSKGYVCGNVRIISDRANTLKRDATSKELEALALDALAHN